MLNNLGEGNPARQWRDLAGYQHGGEMEKSPFLQNNLYSVFVPTIQVFVFIHLILFWQFNLFNNFYRLS
jgi:hypothetical protein